MTTMKKPPGKPFTKGQSGNPAGKPKGTRNRMTALATAVLEKDVEAIAKVITTAALRGDLQAARLVIERLCPPMRERPIDLELPDTTSSGGIALAQQAILQAVARGDLVPGEGTILTGIVEQHRRALETQDLEARIVTLEGKPK